MISSNRASEAVSVFAFIEYHVLKVFQHRRSCAPDAAAAIDELVGFQARAVPFEPADSQRAAVENEAERHLEDARDLARIGCRDELAIFDQADDGSYGEAGTREELVERADDFDGFLLEPDFLVRLAQRRRGRGLGGLDTAARQADLARMILEMRRARREQNRRAARAIEQREQDRRRPSGPLENLAQLRRDGPVGQAKQALARIARRTR